MAGCGLLCGACWTISCGGGGSIFFCPESSMSASYSLMPKRISDITVCGVDHANFPGLVRDAKVESNAHHCPSSPYVKMCHG